MDMYTYSYSFTYPEKSTLLQPIPSRPHHGVSEIHVQWYKCWWQWRRYEWMNGRTNVWILVGRNDAADNVDVAATTATTAETSNTTTNCWYFKVILIKLVLCCVQKIINIKHTISKDTLLVGWVLSNCWDHFSTARF